MYTKVKYSGTDIKIGADINSSGSAPLVSDIYYYDLKLFRDSFISLILTNQIC